MKITFKILATILLCTILFTACDKDTNEEAMDETAINIIDEKFRGDLDMIDKVVITGQTYSMKEVLQDEQLFQQYKDADLTEDTVNENNERILKIYAGDDADFAMKRLKKSNKGNNASKKKKVSFAAVVILHDGENGGGARYTTSASGVFASRNGDDVTNINIPGNWRNRASSATVTGVVEKNNSVIFVTFYSDRNNGTFLKRTEMDGGDNVVYKEFPTLGRGVDNNIESIQISFAGI